MKLKKKGVKLALKKSEDADLNIIVIEPKSSYFTGFLKDLILIHLIIINVFGLMCAEVRTHISFLHICIFLKI